MLKKWMRIWTGIFLLFGMLAGSLLPQWVPNMQGHVPHFEGTPPKEGRLIA